MPSSTKSSKQVNHRHQTTYYNTHISQSHEVNENWSVNRI